MKTFKRVLIILFIVLTCTGCDQSTKFLATSFLEPHSIISYANDMFRFQYAENHGAFLGLGSNLTEEYRFKIFTIAVSFALAAMLIYTTFSKKLSTYGVFALSLAIGGGISNLYDRVVNNGAVVDFLNIGIGGLRTGIFNVADVFIMVGFAMLLFHSLVTKEKGINDL